MIVKPRTRRENNGYALIAVLSIGAFASIFLLSLVAMTDSLIRSDSMQKQKAVLLDAAETGLDFAINDLNMGIMHVTEGSTVDPTVEEAFKETQLPADYLPDPSQNLTVKIRVSRLDNTTIESIKAQSYLYNPSKDESGYF
ncbi:MAG: hypothetical protein K8F91_25620, partial [Candidatus Obscuribacterales bacterium]|nr:hypothetical protein [Candidatus Obscuribacterales bacterium]